MGGGLSRRWRGGSAWVGYPSGQREQTVNLPAHAFEGSNPSPTISRGDSEGEPAQREKTFAGVAQLVERKPSKLDVAGSSPVSRSAHVAQLVEHTLGKGEVTGSIPVVSSEEQRLSALGSRLRDGKLVVRQTMNVESWKPRAYSR